MTPEQLAYQKYAFEQAQRYRDFALLEELKLLAPLPSSELPAITIEELKDFE